MISPVGHPRFAGSNPDQRSTGSDDPVPEFITVPEWSPRVGCAPDSGYRAARRDEIPGLFRIGRLMRVNWQPFVEAPAAASLGTAAISRDGSPASGRPKTKPLQSPR